MNKDTTGVSEAFLLRMQRLLKDEYDSYLDSLTKPPYKGIRINLLRRENIPLPEFSMRPSGFADNSWIIEDDVMLGGTWPYLCGVIYPQEPAASLPVTALKIEKGMKVLDLCAAPGSKSTQIAEQLGHTGVLVCNEIVPKRAEILKENIERQGIVNAIILNSTPEKIAASFAGWFDAVLVDAPCSGEGMFRREPDAVRMWSEDNVLLCARRQKEILTQAAACVKPGGRLVYSTCTFSEEENEQNVNWFLDTFPNFELVPAAGIGHYGTEALKAYESVRRIYPMDGGEGQFLACFRSTECRTSADALPLLKSDPVPSAAESFLKKSLQGSFPYLFAKNGQIYGGTFPFTDCGRNRLIRHQCFLGTVKSGRFEPSHALAMNAWARFAETIELTEAEAEAYRRGETIPRKHEKGWIAVTVNGDILGLSKSDGMMLKNHYPKSFRKR